MLSTVKPKHQAAFLGMEIYHLWKNVGTPNAKQSHKTSCKSHSKCGATFALLLSLASTAFVLQGDQSPIVVSSVSWFIVIFF
jgi:hypothetical protein